MATRLTKETLYIRREFSTEHRLKMGDELAQAHNRMADIEEEEASMKATIKERKTGVEATIGSLSRNLANGWEMVNVPCELVFDSPNVGEVTYVSEGEHIEKVRPMTATERQMDLPLTDREGEVVVIPPVAAEASAEASAGNIAEFFEGDTAVVASGTQVEPSAAEANAAEETAAPVADGHWDEVPDAPTPSDAPTTDSEPKPDPVMEVIAGSRKKSGPADLATFHKEQQEKDAKPAIRRPRGFSKPANESAW